MVYNTKYTIKDLPLTPFTENNFLSTEEINKIYKSCGEGSFNTLHYADRDENGDVAHGTIIENIKVHNLDIANDFKWLAKKIMKYVTYKIKTSDFPEIKVDKLSRVALYRYYGGAHLSWHDDSIYDGSHSQRKFISIINLSTFNDDYTGGLFKIRNYPDISHPGHKDFAAKPGTIVVAPVYMKHMVSPVTSGIRDVIVCWPEGPYWR